MIGSTKTKKRRRLEATAGSTLRRSEEQPARRKNIPGAGLKDPNSGYPVACALGPNHTDIVVRKLRVSSFHNILWHVAGNAIAGSRLASRFGSHAALRVGFEGMARKTLRVICTQFGDQGLMRVVTGNAGNTGIATLSPAAAFLQAVRLKTQARSTDVCGHVHFHIGPCTMASPTKIH